MQRATLGGTFPATAVVDEKGIVWAPAIAPSKRQIAITPNDGADLATWVRSISCGGSGGYVVVENTAGDKLRYPIAPYGMIGPIDMIKKVYATDTTATELIGYA